RPRRRDQTAHHHLGCGGRVDACRQIYRRRAWRGRPGRREADRRRQPHGDRVRAEGGRGDCRRRRYPRRGGELSMIAHLTIAGAIHAALALLCIAVGLTQFLRPKRGAGHRARGYFYVYAMLVADGTAMLVYQFSGHLNLFHVGAIGNFICIVLAIVPLLRSPRPVNWRLTHYYFISWSYVSLMS